MPTGKQNLINNLKLEIIMIQTKDIEKLEDFKRLKKGDIVAVEWRRNCRVGKEETRFATYTIVENKERTTEIVLQIKGNVYFNYTMFLNPETEGYSNCKAITLIRSIE